MKEFININDLTAGKGSVDKLAEIAKELGIEEFFKHSYTNALLRIADEVGVNTYEIVLAQYMDMPNPKAKEGLEIFGVWVDAIYRLTCEIFGVTREEVREIQAREIDSQAKEMVRVYGFIFKQQEKVLH